MQRHYRIDTLPHQCPHTMSPTSSSSKSTPVDVPLVNYLFHLPTLYALPKTLPQVTSIPRHEWPDKKVYMNVDSFNAIKNELFAHFSEPKILGNFSIFSRFHQSESKLILIQFSTGGDGVAPIIFKAGPIGYQKCPYIKVST